MADYSSKNTSDQVDNTIPGSTSKNTTKRSTYDLLPEYLQSDTNKKFLNATLDQMILSGNPKIESGYIGKKIGAIRTSAKDVYTESKTTLNNRYQVDPTVVSQNPSTLEYESAIPYDDIISKLKYLETNTTNLDKLFSDYNYAWKPPINYDMFVNWNSYVWLPFGLPLVGLHGETKAGIEGKRTYTTSAQVIHGNRTLTLENGMRLAFINDTKTYLVTGVGKKITLIDESTLCSVTETSMGLATPTQALGTVDTGTGSVASYSIGTQGTNYVHIPFVNVYDQSGTPSTHAILEADVNNGAVDTTLTITNAGAGYATSGVTLHIMGGQTTRPPYVNANKDVHYMHEYICMEKSARDNNAWSRVNNWYHINTIQAVNTMLNLTKSFKLDGIIVDDDYAQRPIIEWERDLHLYNYGTHFRKPVDIIITEAMDPADAANGFLLSGGSAAAEVHDGYTVQDNDRVLFVNSSSDTYNNKIYKVNTANTGATALTLETDGRGAGPPTHGDVVTSLNGTTLQGQDYWFDGRNGPTAQTSSQTTWRLAQEKGTKNVPVKFELYDTTFQPLSEYNETDFLGNTVFEYLEDKTTADRSEDKFLGFPLTYATTNYLSSTNTSNLMFNNSHQQTMYLYDRGTIPKDILGLYYLRKFDRDISKYDFDNCWEQSYKQIRTPITVTRDITNAEDDFVVDLGTTNFEPERDYNVIATTTGFEFCLKSAYGFEKLSGINPTLYLAKGQTYTFDITNGTTTFQIQDASASAYGTGVTNNNTHSGIVTFAVSETEPNDVLYYSSPSGTGKLIIIDKVLEQRWPEVYHNGVRLTRDTHYIFNGKNVVIPYESSGTDETVSDAGVPVFSPANQTQSTDNLLAVGDIVDVKFYTTDTSATDEWAYDVPNGLKNNPGNEVLGNISYAEIFPHIIDLIDKHPGLKGPAFGNNNYRSLGGESGFGGTINHQISPLLKLGLMLGNENYDLLLALDYTADSYNVFKKKFIQKIEQLYASMDSGTITSALVDQALYDLNLGKNNTFPFANSDMAYYFNMVEKTYSVTTSTSTFTLPKTITRKNQYHNHVYVYTIDTNDVETFETEFTLDPNANTITLGTAVASGKVVIKVSIDEGLSFIPPTLAKLGVAPTYVPKSYVDDTGSRTVVVIEGHDGSKTVAHDSTITGSGSVLSHTITDYRDKALLELENRIYGHIQSEFNSDDDNIVTYSHSPESKRKDLTLFPGKYRTTPYTITDRNNFYDNYFNAFKIARGITLLPNTGYDANNKFTWNYSADANANGIGYWRGIYKHYFDTDRPHSHPWEMLGFIGKPSWWDTHYEWVNATKRNNMISALQKGIISEPGQTIVQDINVARPSATFPVAVDGTLQDPVTATLMSSPTALEAKASWSIGDSSPIETVWERTSLFPYVENEFLFSINPAKYLEKYYDTKDRITDSGSKAITIDVTTAPKAGNTSGTVFYIDGVQQKKLVLQAGNVYTFNLTDSSYSGHDFQLSEAWEGQVSGQYTTGWDEATDATKPTFSPTSSTPEILYYYDSQGGLYHAQEGGVIEVVSVERKKQFISNKTKKRHNSNELFIHNEVDNNSLSRRILGLQQPIVDRLMFLGNDIYVDFARQQRQLNTKLSYKMQGFSKKSSISMLADSLQSEKSNNFIPNDDLTIKFHNSSPYKEYIYSGVEIIKTSTGYAVYGYHNDKPYFIIQNQLKPTIKQITVSETNIQLHSEFDTGTKRIDYGTEFKSANDVYNFLYAYGKYLENVGFEFHYPNQDGVYEDWTLTAQQFILWSEAEWGDDTSIKLSPAGNLLYFKTAHGHIKSNDYEYGSFYLDVNKSLFDSTTVDVDRQLNYVTVKPKDESRAIYCASFVVCDYEHLLIINNKTIFDDMIYYPILGDAKHRFKIEYLKTPEWNGSLHAPGYLVYGDTIYENFDKTVDNITSSYFASEQTGLNKDSINVARKNIGYEKKQFLRNMRLSEDVQFQFMKGVSHLKGTPEVFNRLTRSTFLLEASVDINLEEEWMFRLGEFGPESKQTTKEFTLKNTDIKANPQLINFGEIYQGQATDFDYDTTISMLGGDGRWLEQPSTNPAVQFSTRPIFDQSIDTLAEIETYEKDLPNAGYPRLEETSYQVFKLEDLPTLYDKYKNDDSSLLYKLLQTPNWKDTYTYAKGYYVRYKGKRYTSTRIINAAAKSFYGIVNAKYTKTHASGNLAELVIEKCVFTVDGITKVTATADPYLYGITGVTARFGEFDFSYYTPSASLSNSTVDPAVAKGADANGDFTYILSFADGQVPAVNVPADDDKMYLSAFNYKTDAEAADSTVLDRWIETGEAGLFNVWTADTGAGDWSTFNLQDDNFGIEQICKGYETGDEALIKLGVDHNLAEGDYVMITGAENNPALNGIHKITGFPTGSDCQTCGLRENKQFYIDEFVGSNEVYGKVFAFRKSRFSDYSAMFASIANTKWNWVTNNYAYCDAYYDVQAQAIGASSAAGSYNPSFAGGTSFTLTSSYELVYPATAGDLDVFVGEFRQKFEPGSGGTKAWEVIGTTIIFYPENLGGTFQAGQPLMIVYKNRTRGWGSFKYDATNRTFVEMNKQQPKADTGQLANVIVYDYEQNKELARAEVWDPFKGIVPGIAEAEIDIISGYDQALYNATTQDTETLTSTRNWGQHEVGISWWNLNTVRYIEYEQPLDLDYTFKHWGEQFPGSSMDIYEWTKSTVAPDEWVTLVEGNYEIDGEIASGEAYTKILSGVTHYYWCEEEALDPQTGQVSTFYYFWVKNKTSVPQTQSHREISTKVIGEYLNDPTAQGLFWAAPGGASNIITGNVGERLTQNSVFQINFTSDIDDSHKEWITIREEDQETTIPNRFANRLHESILGIDENKDLLKVAGIEEDQNYTYTTPTPTGAGLFTFVKASAALTSDDSDVRDVKFNTDGTKMFMLGRANDKVYEYSVSTAFDVSTITYAQSLDVSGQDVSSNSIEFNTDGTILIMLGQNNDKVYEYALSTGFDLSTASYTDSFDISTQELQPYGLAFNNDGTKMYVTGWAGDDINEYTLTTGFDVSTATYSQNFDVSSQAGKPSAVQFQSDGTTMYVLNGSGAPTIFKYTLSTAFDVSTASYSNKSFEVTNEETKPRGFCFNNNGLQMFLCGWHGDDINEYTVHGASTTYSAKKYNYDWNQKLEYMANDVVKSSTKLYKTHKELPLVKTNTKLSIDNQTTTIQLRIGEKAGELTFPASVEIGTPPAESNTYGLPYENVVAYAYANIVSGKVDSIVMNRPGQGYNSATPPTVTISAPTSEGGIQATVIDSDITIVNGEITAIAMDSTRKGSGYESSYAVIDEGESNEEILELKYYDRFATRRFNADVNMLTNGDFEQKTTAFWSTKLGTIDPTGKVATVAIYGGGTGYSSGIAATTGGAGTGLTLDITQINGVIQSATVQTGGGGYTVGDVVSVLGGTDGTFTIATVNSSAVVYGLASGVYTGASQNATHYVGQRSLKNANLAGGTILQNIQYQGKALFKTNTSLDSVKLKYGHSATDVDFDAMTAVTLTPAVSSEKTSLGTTLVYSVQGEFVSSTDDYHAMWLEIEVPDSNGFIMHIDSMEFTNPAVGDRIIVGRAAQSTTAVAHDQYATFKELGNFNRQRWQELLTYNWIDDRNISVDSPNMVPNLRLHNIFRYGGQIRPYKQSWIKSRVAAIRALIQNANKNLLKINLSDSYLNWKKHLGQSFAKGNSTFAPQDYWKYVDWFHPDFTISSSSVAQYTVGARNELYDVNEDVYSVVRVDSDDADGNWAFYQWVDDNWFKIGKQNGTIELSSLLYDVQDIDAGWDAAEYDIGGWDKNYTNELQAILKGLHEDIFIDTYKQYYKELFFTVIHFIYAEQTNLDWVAKTTFLQLQRKTPGALTPKTFDVGSEEDILAYLNEVKPYHSKIETVFDSRTFEEEINASADEVVDIRVQTNTSGSTETANSRAFRMFIDNTGTRIYETMIDANKTTTTEVLDSKETEISVTSITPLPTAPGEVVIGAERIRYETTNTGVLQGCTRGVAGTAAATHASGVTVTSAGPTVALPVDPDPEAYNAFNDDGTTTIQSSTNTQAALINVGKGTI